MPLLNSGHSLIAKTQREALISPTSIPQLLWPTDDHRLIKEDETKQGEWLPLSLRCDIVDSV